MAEEKTVWEYQVMDLPYNARARMELLNKNAQEGWELFTVVFEGEVRVAYMRRPAQASSAAKAPE